ncbi:ribonuclease HI [Dehalogenimonas sp. WBC-2]|nr:ribonuclease HI [Dehalogenimonas sp. WBC-2]
MTFEDAFNIYTDGSSRSHPRTGGIGIRLIVVNSDGIEETEDIELPGYHGSTNNQMELLACIEGIKQAMRHLLFGNFGRIAIFSDSIYVVENQSRAFWTWSRNRWLNNDGKAVDNADLWKELLRVIKRCQKRVDFYWIKGHSKDQHNKAVDKMAKRSSKNPLNPPVSIIKVRRKLSERSVDPGCVPIKGQRIFIRVINDTYLALQRRFKYKYEVISTGNPCQGYVDFIYSEKEIMLNAGHCYSVKLNDNPKNPMIIKVFRELEKRKA